MAILSIQREKSVVRAPKRNHVTFPVNRIFPLDEEDRRYKMSAEIPQDVVYALVALSSYLENVRDSKIPASSRQ